MGREQREKREGREHKRKRREGACGEERGDRFPGEEGRTSK